jgi:hypothetical protein
MNSPNFPKDKNLLVANEYSDLSERQMGRLTSIVRDY